MEAGRIARQISDTDLLVRAALTRGSGAEGIEFADPERLELLELALLSVGEADSPERAGLLAALAEELDPSDWQRKRESVDEAMAIARRLGDDASLLAILTRTSYVAGLPERLEQRHADVTVGLALAERANDVVSSYDLHMILHQIALVRADLVAADAHLDAMRAIAQATGLLRHEYPLRCAESMRMLLNGRLAECERALGPTLELGTRIGNVGAGATYGAHLVNIRLQQGRIDEVIDLFEPIVTENPSIAVLRSALMMVYCEAGRLDDARVLFEHDAANAFADFPHDPVWLSTMARLADVVVALHDESAAALLLDWLVPFVGQVALNAAVTAGATDLFVARLLAVLGRYDEIDAHFTAALEIHERLEAPYLIARTRLDWADALRERNQPDDASLSATHAAAAQLIATPMASPLSPSVQPAWNDGTQRLASQSPVSGAEVALTVVQVPRLVGRSDGTRTCSSSRVYRAVAAGRACSLVSGRCL